MIEEVEESAMEQADKICKQESWLLSLFILLSRALLKPELDLKFWMAYALVYTYKNKANQKSFHLDKDAGCDIFHSYLYTVICLLQKKKEGFSLIWKNKNKTKQKNKIFFIIMWKKQDFSNIWKFDPYVD